MYKAKHLFKSKIGKNHEALTIVDVYALAEKEAFDISDTENEEILTSIAQKDEIVALLKKPTNPELLRQATATDNGSKWNYLSQILHVKRDDISGKPIIENGEFVLKYDTKSVKAIEKSIAKLKKILQSAKNENLSAAHKEIPVGNPVPLTEDNLNTRNDYIKAIQIGIEQYEGKKDLGVAVLLMAALNDFKGDNLTPLKEVVAHIESVVQASEKEPSKNLLCIYINKAHNGFCRENREGLLGIESSIFKEQIFPELSLPDAVKLGQVSTFFHTITAPELRREKMIQHIAHREYDKADEIINNAPEVEKENLRFTKFLQHVGYGQQPEAKVMAEANPAYLSQKGTVTDYSGRTFHNITAFQYALWALDRHMWTMLREIKDEAGNPVLSDDEAAAQLNALEKNPEQFSPHGPHYDSTELTDAYKTYIDSFDNWNRGERDSHWIKDIGGAQRNVPAHVAQEFLRRDRYLVAVITSGIFEEKTLPRADKDHDNKFWYPIAPDGLGVSFSYRPGSRVLPSPAVPEARWPGLFCAADSGAIIKLFEVRTEELKELKQSLDLSDPKSLLPF